MKFVAYALLWIAGAALPGCKTEAVPPTDRTATTAGALSGVGTEIIPGLRVAVIGARRSFGGNVEIFVSVENTTDGRIELGGLSSADGQLTDSAGGAHALHPMSVGVAKPVVVEPRRRIRTSFLFDGGGDNIDSKASGMTISLRDRAIARTEGK